MLALILASAVRADPGDLCDAAAARAAEATGVPLAVLRAITRAETGRGRDGRLQPWPWTVNMEGAGRWFDSLGAALAHVQAHLDAGARSFDLGCFQINHRWHGEAFASLDEMFDPNANALHAARFLARLHDETGDWTRAAGAYHSRTSELADRYVARFEHILAGLQEAPAAYAGALPGTVPRPNTYPLLQATAAGAALGSLVPLAIAARPALVELAPFETES